MLAWKREVWRAEASIFLSLPAKRDRKATFLFLNTAHISEKCQHSELWPTGKVVSTIKYLFIYLVKEPTIQKVSLPGLFKMPIHNSGHFSLTIICFSKCNVPTNYLAVWL